MSVFADSVFAGSVFATGGQVVAVRRDAGSVGHGGRKRKKWVIGEREVVGTREELEAVLAQMLQKPTAQLPAPTPVKVAPKDKAIVQAFPNYTDLRDMLIAAQQIEAAQILRATAQRLADEQDEQDVEVLLLWG